MKFAYLIMAHHRFDVLKMLLSDLDHQDNDVFLHIDKKSKNPPVEELKKCVQKSRLIIIPSIPVYWGHSSQTQCVLNLLEKAANYDTYDYYHLLVGVEFPLKTQDKIHQFFAENRGKEFIGFDHRQGFENRIKYYYFWKKYSRDCDTLWKKMLLHTGRALVKLQKIIGVNRLKHVPEYYHKGYANWSITDGLARLFLEHSREIMKACRWSYCADEVCFHTILYHSVFFNNVYDPVDEYHSVMRITTWQDAKNQFHPEDIPMLLKSGRLFARKFDDEKAMDSITTLIRMRE